MFADVTSANVVGYAEKQIPANKFKQCGAQFQDIATETLLADKVLGGLPGVAFDKNGIFTSPNSCCSIFELH